MAEIISASLDKETLMEINKITKELNLKGRSEAIRLGIKTLSLENKENSKLRGNINATLSIVHDHAKNINLIQHKFQNIVISHLHNHFKNNKCLDTFVLSGKGEIIKELFEKFKKNKNLEQTKLIIC